MNTESVLRDAARISVLLYSAWHFSGDFGYAADPVAPARQTRISIVLPIRIEEVTYRSMGIFPYGIPAPGHPTGHPGFDFELKLNAPVLAAADGMVASFGDSPIPQNPGQKTISLYHSLGYHTFYTGSLKNIAVTKGQSVKQGQKIAEIGQMPEFKFAGGSFHFGLVGKSTKESFCPYEYMTDSARKSLEWIHKKAIIRDRAKYPEICSPCGEGGCK